MIWGKVAGAFFGYLISGGNLFGAVIGALIGHLFDKGMRQGGFDTVFHTVRDRQHIQQVFFKTVFSMLGHISKADGRVSEDEIQAARAIMQQMRLDDLQTKQAIGYFTEGKQIEFYADKCIDEFVQVSHHNRLLAQMLLEILIVGALADRVLHPNEDAILANVSTQLGFDRNHYLRIVQMVQAQQHFHQDSRGQAGYQQQPRPDALKEAYAVLGVNESASDAEVKRAYRRQMNEHHPDKLVAKGLPEAMIKMANEKTQEIKAAYELIQQARK